MRFIILALALIGVALYISNPQAFGVKQKFQLSENGRVVSRAPERSRFDFSIVGELGAELYKKFTASPSDSASSDGAEIANNQENTALSGAETLTLSAIDAPDITTYAGQLSAIAAAMRTAPEATTAQMRAATQACLPAQAPEPLANYFAGLVQVVAQTAQLPQAQQVESFKAQSAPLTQVLKAWLTFMPEEPRAENTAILQDWAARPKDLVACHLAWLGAE